MIGYKGKTLQLVESYLTDSGEYTLDTIMTLHKSDEWDNDDDRDKAAVDKPNSEGNKECREDEDEVRN